MTEEKSTEEKSKPTPEELKKRMASKLTPEQLVDRRLFIVDRIKAGDRASVIAKACKERWGAMVSNDTLKNIAFAHKLEIATSKTAPTVSETVAAAGLTVPTAPIDVPVPAISTSPGMTAINRAIETNAHNTEADFKAALELLKPAMLAMKVRSLTAFFDADGKLKTKIERVSEDTFDV